MFKNRKCKPCEGGTEPFSVPEIEAALKELPGWHYNGSTIHREFLFTNYAQTTAFVNQVVKVANAEDHHPDICFGYKSCSVYYVTHAIKGISENDFICAAKINDLVPA